jgi:hypothetical protein
MRRITDIYKEYKTPPALGEHMLRVAAVASVICENFDKELPKTDIVTACLLHDMGNIIKFKMDALPGFFEPEGVEYWQDVQDEYKKKYGSDEKIANVKIAKELKVSDKILELIEAIRFLGAEDLLNENFEKQIVDYCDNRVSPFGVVALEGRFVDLRKRYTNHGEGTPERRAFENSLRQIEKQIFTKCKIKPEDINDKSVKPIIEKLRNFVISP